MTNEIKNTNQTPDDEIDLIALAKTIWEGRKFIIVTVLLFMCIGVAVALLTPKKYSASTTLVPQMSDTNSKMGGLSSLAAMAGFNLNNMAGGSKQLSPMVYPQIVKSVPFQLELMNIPFTFEGVDHPVSIYEYYTEYSKPGILSTIKKYTIGLPFVILKAIKPKAEEELPLTTIPDINSPIYLTKEQEEVRKILDGGLSLTINDKDGFVTLEVNTEQAKLAAEIAQKAQKLLQKYITTFKIEKASAQLKFIEERYIDNKAEFEEAQSALANFRDKNKNVTSARAQTQEERLQSDYQLAFNVYSGLAQQLEQARIQVKEDTPVFSILKPVTVPLEDSGSGLITLVIWTFLGGVIAVAWIFGKEFLGTIREKWNSEEV